MVRLDTFSKPSVYVDVKLEEVEDDIKLGDIKNDVKPVDVDCKRDGDEWCCCLQDDAWRLMMISEESVTEEG